MITRILNLEDINNDSIFIWGARQVGKTTLLKKKYPNAVYYDLLQAKDFERLLRNPDLLNDDLALLNDGDTVIIDEVQKIPQLLDEVHSLIFRKNIRFILSGSSPRKLKRHGANLLGGRALKAILYPLVSVEIPDFDIHRAVRFGTLPRHYLISDPWKRLGAYIGVYLNEEIREEALSRQLKTFSKFMEVAAFSNGEMVVYKNIAQDCGIDYRTVKDYFEILVDTLVGYMIPCFGLTKKRRSLQASKFYYFDVGVANYLRNRRNIQLGSTDFGHAFEHFIIQELIAYLAYNEKEERLTYWRTTSGYEVDAIIGTGLVAIEIKATEEIQPRHLKGLKAFKEEFPDCRLMAVSFDFRPRITNGIEIYPVNDFLKKLWNHEII
ncbi:MAG: AAA family ATPase [Lentimicrobiaceae bacterium]|nr:AAA family ATPase [Lentimicrobiaceae bacterium]